MAKAKKALPSKKKSAATKKVLAVKSKKVVAKKVAVKNKAKKVAAIPKGYNSITPYLIVSNGAKAIEFYKKAFDAKEVKRMAQPDGKICHAELKFGDTKIMLGDEYPEMDSRAPESYGGSPVGIYLYIKDVDAVVKRAVKAGAKLKKPVENQFWGDRSGALVDPFGHTWCVATHIEDVTPAQMRKRAAEVFGKK